MLNFNVNLQQNFTFIKSIELSDWISSIHFYENGPTNSFCCLTAHSVALHLTSVWDEKDPERAGIEVTDRLSCVVKEDCDF